MADEAAGWAGGGSDGTEEEPEAEHEPQPQPEPEQGEVERLRDENDELRSKLQKADALVEQLQRRLQRISGGDDEGDDAGATLQSLRKAVEEQKEEIAKWQEKVRHLEAQEEAGRQELETLRSRSKQHSEEQRALRDEKMKAEHSAAEWKGKCKAMEAEVEGCKAQRDRAVGESSRLKLTVEEQTSKLSRLHSELQAEKDARAEEMQAKDKAESACVDLQGEVDRERSRSRGLAEQLQLAQRTRDADNRRLRGEMEALRRERDSARSKAGEASRRAEELERLQRDAAEKLALEQRAHQQAKERHLLESKDLTQKWDAATVEVGRLREQLDAVHPMIRGGTGGAAQGAPFTLTDVQRMKTELERTTRELAEHKASAERIAQKYRDAAEAQKRLEHENRELQEANTSLRVSRDLAKQDLINEQRRAGTAAEAAADRDSAQRRELQRRLSEAEHERDSAKLKCDSLIRMLDEERQLSAQRGRDLDALIQDRAFLSADAERPDPAAAPAGADGSPAPGGGGGAEQQSSGSGEVEEAIQKLKAEHAKELDMVRKEAQSREEDLRFQVVLNGKLVEDKNKLLELAQQQLKQHRDHADAADSYAATVDSELAAQERQLGELRSELRKRQREGQQSDARKAALMQIAKPLLRHSLVEGSIQAGMDRVAALQHEQASEAAASLVRQLDQAKQEKAAIERDCDLLRETNSKQHKQFQHDLSEVQAKLAVTVTQLQSARSNEEQLRRDNDQKQHLLQQANDRVDKLEAQMRIRNQGITAGDAEVLLQSADGPAQVTRQMLEEEREARERAEERARQLAGGEHRAKTSIQEWLSLEEENKTLKRQLGEERAGRAEHERELAQRAEELGRREDTVRKQEDQLKATLDSLQKENATLKKDLEKQKQDLARERGTYQEAVDKYDVVQQRYEEQTILNAGLVKTLSELEQKLESRGPRSIEPETPQLGPAFSSPVRIGGLSGLSGEALGDQDGIFGSVWAEEIAATVDDEPDGTPAAAAPAADSPPAAAGTGSPAPGEAEEAAAAGAAGAAEAEAEPRRSSRQREAEDDVASGAPAGKRPRTSGPS
eukprot:TRINITY_DN22426_c0_g1_i1.p1 TRINITY_DN22426_c0_g1~~TRINITY_DN22426_c0_g1_i1.p1  ORF type:complete len:1100 (+),score=506.12 TRINITY_DN22426_c0_g1_i1:91-3300(+)